jgi:4-hydroxythreonine-4-phosphate dehydrogenase
MGFGNTLNVTLGLPFIRLSVDHGTAYEIAGKNQADFSSMAEALKTSVSLL